MTMYSDAATKMTAAQSFSFRSVPDKGEVRVKITAEGLPNMVYPSVLSLPVTLQSELARSTQRLWYPLPNGTKPPAATWIVNHCADADEYRGGLIWLDETYGSNTPIFNHPRAIARSRRDHSSAALQGIEGLIVPRVARFRASSRTAFERCFADNGFHFPVLVRPSASQTGRGLLKIEGPQDWNRAVDTMWFGKPHFMTQFVEFATDDGVYLKARVIFIGNRFFVRHVKGATGWKVHNDTDNSIANFEERELELIESLNNNALFLNACAAIPARTSLDFGGMDVGIDPARNRFVLFECNAAMTVFSRSIKPLNAQQQARREQLQAPISAAFEQHLHKLDGWVWNNREPSQEKVFSSCRDLLAD